MSSEIFISYSRKDHAKANALAQELKALGIAVWWDNLLSPGDFVGKVLTHRINSASAVVVLWTKDSVDSQWVIAEATIAFDQQKLVPVRAADVKPDDIPVPFNSLHSISDGDISGLAARLTGSSIHANSQRGSAPGHGRMVRRAMTALAGLFLLGVVLLLSIASARQYATSAIETAISSLLPCSDLELRSGTRFPRTRQCVSATAFDNAQFKDCPICPSMVVIPGGPFVIGSPERERGRDVDEEPQATIVLRPYAIGRFEITRAQWNACVVASVCQEKFDRTQVTFDSQPVNSISWYDTQDYLAWLSKITGYRYRLPSEAEWEYAARGGEPGPNFWRGSASAACEFANIGDLSFAQAVPDAMLSPPQKQARQIELGGQHDCDDHEPLLSAVGKFKPNPFNLHDVLGNVWEWVQDCAFPNYKAIPRNGAAYAEPNCRVGVLRGGSYMSGPASARLANRFQGGRDKATTRADAGFRVARDL